MSSGDVELWLVVFFLREAVGCAYVQEWASSRLTQFSHGCDRLHLSLNRGEGARSERDAMWEKGQEMDGSLSDATWGARERDAIPFSDDFVLVFRGLCTAVR